MQSDFFFPVITSERKEKNIKYKAKSEFISVSLFCLFISLFSFGLLLLFLGSFSIYIDLISE
jgi:hypothetical protein